MQIMYMLGKENTYGQSQKDSYLSTDWQHCCKQTQQVVKSSPMNSVSPLWHIYVSS